MKQKLYKYRKILLAFLAIYLAVMIYHVYKPLPDGISFKGENHQISSENIEFYYNLTEQKGNQKQFDDQIFQRTLEMIEEADQFIVADYFLFNSYHEAAKEYPEITGTIAAKLIEKKQKNPDMSIIFISDGVNSSYRSHPVPELERMKEQGIEVVMTNVKPLRDSTPVYSALWRIFFQWFGHEGEGWMPNALAATAPEMTVRSYLDLFNIKANHRKTLTTEKGTLISSANPHDASAFFANVAIEVKDTALVNDVLKTEQAAASLSEDIRFPKAVERENEQKDAYAQLLTEGAIQEEVISEIESTEKGDEIWLAMFYLADRNVVRGLTDAANRGVEVRMVLDTNKHSFGKKKTGLPNVSTTDELREDTNGRIKVRWYAPAPEQFHPKMMYIKHKNYSTIIGGSANFTSRNLNDFNLETDIKLTVKNESEIAAAIDHYYRMIWNNQGAVYTVEYNEQDTSIAPLQRGIYAIQKLLHLTTY